MADPAEYNFSTRSGNTGTQDNANGLVLVIEGASNYVFHFKTASFTGGPISKTSPADITVEGDRVTIPFSLADNALLASAGGLVAYEVERRGSGGTQRSFLVGNITGIQGISDD